MKKYFQLFPLVELQSTFYKLPTLETAKKWKEIAPSTFIFTVKAFQGITHPISSPTWRKAGLKEQQLKALKDKVGFLRPTPEVLSFWNQNLEICKILNAPICLVQLPASFKEQKEHIKSAEQFFSKIKRNGVSIALELRGWSKEGFKAMCKKFDLISCVDPFALEPLWFSSKRIAYFRLHGSYEKERINYRHKYSYEELKRLKHLILSLKVKTAFVLFNNLSMLEDAKTFQELLKK